MAVVKMYDCTTCLEERSAGDADMRLPFILEIRCKYINIFYIALDVFY
jgi:hypothetical protein